MALTTQELKQLAKARLGDAVALQEASRHDGAAYLCGYAAEIALKARICETLGWNEFPATRKEFEGLTSFKTHSLELLLRLSGKEGFVKSNLLTEWSIVAAWDPESRYQPVGKVKAANAASMIAATATLLEKV